MKLNSKIFGQGTPLIVMHGLFGMLDNWQSFARSWSDDYQVHILDLRNHGKSPHSDEFSYDVMSDDLLEYMQDHDIKKAHILGHSMGGKLAMLFAALNPDKVNKLIIADIAPKYYAPHHQEIISALRDLKLDEIKSRGQAQEEFGKGMDEGVKFFLLKSLYWQTKEKLAWRFNLEGIVNKIEEVGLALPELARFDGESLFIRGGKSNYISDQDQDDIAELFLNSSFETIPDAGHWLHAEKPKEFSDIVLKFLKD